MKFFMVCLSALSLLLMSSAVFAHTDHALGEGSLHLMYHIVFWFAFAVVVYKAVSWYKCKVRKKSQK